MPNSIIPEPDRGLDQNSVLFHAKVDRLDVRTPYKSALPNLKGKPIWVTSDHYRTLAIHDPLPSDVVALGHALGNLDLLYLEVALDIRPAPSIPPEKREQFLRHLFVNLVARGLVPQGPGMGHRSRVIYRPGFKIIGPFNRRLPRSSDTLYYGWNHDPVQVSVYVKVCDQQALLNVKDFVLRIEVRFRHDGLPLVGLQTLQDLMGFKFRQQLMPYFTHMDGVKPRYRQYHVDSEDQRRMKLVACQRLWDSLGVGAFLPGGRGYRKGIYLTHNRPFNTRAGQALHRLEKAFASINPRVPEPPVKSGNATSGAACEADQALCL